MNNLLVYTAATLTLIVGDLLLMVLGAFMYRQYRSPVKQDIPTASVHQDLAKDLKALSVSTHALGERLARIETQLGRLQQQWEGQHPLPSAKEANRQAIKVATKMALQGADVEEIVNSCGLTRGEAELIRMLHVHSNPENDKPTDA